MLPRYQFGTVKTTDIQTIQKTRLRKPRGTKWNVYRKYRTCVCECGKQFQIREDNLRIQGNERSYRNGCSENCPLRVRKEPPRLTKQCAGCERKIKTKDTWCSRVCRRAKWEHTLANLPIASCVECAASFKPNGPGQQYCSPKCRNKSSKRRRGGNHSSRARRYGSKYETVVAAEVFERDNWTCQSCGRPTPKELRGAKGDLAPELDHIIPLSWSGSHTYENCQCLCRSCNKWKQIFLVLFLMALQKRAA